ncbi:MAG: HTH domain-containing protein [Lentisphaeria bacterium]|nr:HTH domain-containing protein [Lentisphaeria bacterium]NQZ68550.1 HTH domain-containing protein [Lentisphaeria bacterium]
MSDKLKDAQDEFLNHWGVVGPQWGINRTMAQVHALLIISVDPISTDDIMEELAISRGNAHKNLKELQNWGLIRTIIKRGDRKEYFEAEKDVLKMFKLVIKERRRRELDPAIEVVTACAEKTVGMKGKEAELFHKQMKDISELLGTGAKVLDKFSQSDKNLVLTLLLKTLK